MTFLPDGRLLVTERSGTLRIVTTAGLVSPPVTGVPAVVFSGQGGLLDVALDPGFASNGYVYMSYVEQVTPNQSSPSAGLGLAVARGKLTLDSSGNGQLTEVAAIYHQYRAMDSDKNFGGRLSFDRTSGLLYFTAGDRETGNTTIPQDDAFGIGKLINIDTDGRSGRIYGRGFRNSYGLVMNGDAGSFSTDMGPVGGDEFNQLFYNNNYGWPYVSEGNRDDGTAYPRHSTSSFRAPLLTWTPAISPTGMIQYTGTRFADWTNDFVIGSLNAQGLVRVRVSGGSAREMGRVPLGARVREVEQGPDGAIWVLEDGPTGRLLKLTPAA